MIRLKSPQDFFAGLMFMAFGAVGAWVAQRYPFGTSVRMGPGYLPVVISWCMVTLGVIIAARGVVLTGPPVALIRLRPTLLVLGAVLVYAFSIERLGLAISVFLVTALSALGNTAVRLAETAILGVVLAVFCVLVFVYGLSIPLSVWPPQ